MIYDCFSATIDKYLYSELKVFRDMSYREIAETLNISELTVHTHIKRAYKFIRSSLPLLYCFLKYWEQL